MTARFPTRSSRSRGRAGQLLAATIVACGVAACVVSPGLGVAAPSETLGVKQPVPASLSDTESAAEDIVDFVFAHDRASVVATATTLRRLARGQAATALADAGVPAPTVALLGSRADRVARLAPGAPFLDIALAANAVSQLMPGLYAHFQDRVPAAILTLDYLDREAQFRSLAGQPEKVAAAVGTLSRTWAPLRAVVVRAGGASEAAAYRDHVAAMRRLVSAKPSKLQAEAVRGLELVDRLENVFRR